MSLSSESTKNLAKLMMEIEVKFGKGRTDRVKIHFGDDPTTLAQEFVGRHNLKESSIPVISKYIAGAMETYTNSSRVPRPRSSHSVPHTPPIAPPPPSTTSAVSVEPVLVSRSSSTSSKQGDGDDADEVPPPPPLPGSRSISPAAVRKDESPPASVRSGNVGSHLTPNQSSHERHHSSDLDEDGLISRVSRSISSSVDHRHFHDHADRKMTMRTFSLKDIESELNDAAIDLERRNSMDSDISTIAMISQTASSVLDAPSLADRSREHHRRSPFHGIGYQHSSHMNAYKSSRNSSPNPETGGSVETEEYSNSNLSEELSPSSREPGSQRKRNEMFSFDRENDGFLASESEESSVASVSVSAEDMYNKLKQATALTRPGTSTAHGYGSTEWGAATLNARQLKPSSTTMQLSLRKTALSNTNSNSQQNDKSLVGKSTCERLHNAAQLDRSKRERRSKLAVDNELKEIEQNKFKLNANSKKIVSNLRPKGYQNVHIGERLYEEGVVEKKLKYKRAEELKDKLTPEEWSCSRCGTFQKIVNTSIVIQPLHQMQSKARIQNNACDGDDISSPPERICKSCGFDQSKVKIHKPVNVALSQSEESEELLRSRWQGNEPRPENGGIHQYLYENARTRENIQQLNRVLWNEAHSGLTFAPVIPESSVEILQKYKTSQEPQNGDGNGSVDVDQSVHTYSESYTHQQPPLDLGLKEKSILAGPALAEYFSKSATERLSTTQTRPVLANALQAHRRAAETESRASTLNPAGQEEFVNRLVYEYKDKRERQQKLLQYATKHDLNTGEELFKPQVGPDPSEALGLGSSSNRNRDNNTGTKKNVFESIMEKDRMLQIRRKQAQEKAAAAMLEELSLHQVKALETSQQILQQSTENNIAELFQVLLEAQEEVIQDENAKHPSIDDGSSSPVPEWTRLLLDLDQINPDLLIPEVGVLLNEIRAYKLSMLHSNASSRKTSEGEISYTTNMLVSFNSFKALILKCMKRRDGTGRSYVYIPKKKPDVTLQMIEEHRKEETFHPKIDPNSAALCQKRYKDTSEFPIEELLQVEGERIRTKWETARQALILQSSKELTFHPKLYKPPSYVKPKYWGMEQSVPSSDSESEERKGTTGDDAILESNRLQEGEEDAPLNSSSLVSSDEEQQVVHMPALQHRNRPIDQREDKRRKQHLSRAPSHSKSPHHPVEPTRFNIAVKPAPLSPVSAVSDDVTINTISTKFTADDIDQRHHQTRPDTNSINSGNPMVTRRTPSSLRKSGLATPGRVSLSNSNARKAAASGGNKPGRAAPPPLPVEVMSSGSR